MDYLNEHPDGVLIRGLDDVWTAMFSHELEDIFGDVLDYFFDHLNAKKREEFKTLCYTFDKEQVLAAIQYFLGHYHESKMLLFFESLTIDQQDYFLSQLIHQVCDENALAYEKNIIQFRKSLCHLRTDVPDDLEGALEEASYNAFPKLIQFCRKHPEQTLKFIGRLNDRLPHKAKEVLGGMVLELFSYLPKEKEIPPLPDDQPGLKAA